MTNTVVFVYVIYLSMLYQSAREIRRARMHTHTQTGAYMCTHTCESTQWSQLATGCHKQTEKEKQRGGREELLSSQHGRRETDLGRGEAEGVV